MSGVTFRWVASPDLLAKNVGAYGDRLIKAIHALAQVFAARIEAAAKANAPWTDRTGNARQALFTRVLPAATSVTLILAHGMDYGIWLEVKNAGRFAIILKTLESFYGPLMSAIRALIGG